MWSLIRRQHDLRYVLKNKETGDVFFVVVFTLVLKEDLEKEEAAQKSKGTETKPESREGKEKEESNRPTSADDLD